MGKSSDGKPITPWKGSWAEQLPTQRVIIVAHIAHVARDKSNLTALITRALTRDDPDTWSQGAEAPQDQQKHVTSARRAERLPMTLKTLIERLRASLGFGGFRAGGAVHHTEAQKLTAQMARVRSTIPPEHLRRAQAAASAELNRICKEIEEETLKETRARIQRLQEQLAREES